MREEVENGWRYRSINKMMPTDLFSRVFTCLQVFEVGGEGKVTDSDVPEIMRQVTSRSRKLQNLPEHSVSIISGHSKNIFVFYFHDVCSFCSMKWFMKTGFVVYVCCLNFQILELVEEKKETRKLS